MKYIFLVNSFSLKNDSLNTLDDIEKIAGMLGLNYMIEVNSSKYSTEDILKKYQNSQNVIVAVGGDGTINRVINNIYGSQNILGYLPLGTGNDFARSAMLQLKDGLNKVDLIKINDKYFINVACFGIDADIANDDTFTNSKIIPKSQRYNASIITNFFNYQPRHMKLYIDNYIYENDYTTIDLCNGMYYGAGFKIGPHAILDDGLLDVYLINKLNKLKMAKAILGVRNGHHENNPNVTYLKTNKLLLESEKDVTCNLDGEKLTSKRFDIEVLNKAINVDYNQELLDEFQKIKVKKR